MKKFNWLVVAALAANSASASEVGNPLELAAAGAQTPLIVASSQLSLSISAAKESFAPIVVLMPTEAAAPQAPEVDPAWVAKTFGVKLGEDVELHPYLLKVDEWDESFVRQNDACLAAWVEQKPDRETSSFKHDDDILSTQKIVYRGNLFALLLRKGEAAVYKLSPFGNQITKDPLKLGLEKAALQSYGAARNRTVDALVSSPRCR